MGCPDFKLGEVCLRQAWWVRLLPLPPNSPSVRFNKVIETNYRAALDDNHKSQAAAQKLLMDRMLPISVCDKNADIREKITINISSVEIPDREEKVVN